MSPSLSNVCTKLMSRTLEPALLSVVRLLKKGFSRPYKRLATFKLYWLKSLRIAAARICTPLINLFMVEFGSMDYGALG